MSEMWDEAKKSSIQSTVRCQIVCAKERFIIPCVKVTQVSDVAHGPPVVRLAEIHISWFCTK
jgi:hypothetical protein